MRTVARRRRPADFSFGQIDPDWERMAPYLATAMARVPIAQEAGIRTFFCGPECFTPDLAPIVGEAPELPRLLRRRRDELDRDPPGGGIGRVLAQWIVDGPPDVDVTACDVDRLQPYQANPEYRRARTVETLGTVYACHFPGR